MSPEGTSDQNTARTLAGRLFGRINGIGDLAIPYVEGFGEDEAQDAARILALVYEIVTEEHDHSDHREKRDTGVCSGCGDPWPCVIGRLHAIVTGEPDPVLGA